MPPDRENRSPEEERMRLASEELALAFGLQDKPSVYTNIKEYVHQIVDQTLDLRRHSYDQNDNMLRFVQQVTKSFPGYFSDADAKEIRVMALQDYACAYLEDTQNATGHNKKSKRDSKKKASSRSATPFPSPSKGDIVKVPRSRPRPRPTFGSKKTTTALVEEPAPDALMESLPIDSDLDTDAMDVPPVSDISDVEEPDFFVLCKKRPGRRLSFAVPEPSLSPEPELVFAPVPAPVPSPALSPEPEHGSPDSANHIDAFLADCHPPMAHLAAALRVAGVTESVHLLGISKWSEEWIRSFLKNNDIVRTALEEEALVIGFSGVLSDDVEAGLVTAKAKL